MQIFADEWLIDRNGTRAYKVAYPSVKKDDTAGAAAPRLLGNVRVKAYVKKKLTEISEEAKIDAIRVLKEEARLAFSDIRKLFKDGIIIPPDELPDEIALAISGCEIIERIIMGTDDEQVVERRFKYKLWDKGQALRRLETYLGMLVERKEITGKDGNPIKFEDVKNRDDLKAKGDKLLEKIAADG